jgi:hypothetical protein
MTYDNFLKLLDEFEEIQSFAKKIEFANRYFQRIGSGSGRIVYDIDGTKVFKLAKNAKGVAQNEAEINIGSYHDTHSIVTKVLESDNNGSWIISEKAKKVNENRIKQLTGIPSLNDLFYFLRNHEDNIKGGKGIFGQDADIKELLNDNEFAIELEDIMANYSVSAGDLGRPSTYGEVLRDGQPTIVLTDYGLTGEVYNTHYSPNRKKNYRLFELYDNYDGNDDILGDMPPQDAIDTRRGMWAQIPYSVGDGSGVINEGFISFILDRDKYPTRVLPSAPYIVDEFHNCVNNIDETLNHVKNKKKFYENLLKLQEYLIEQKFYDREPLGEIVYLKEDGSALYSTDNAMGQDNFPVHNNIDTSPSIRNDLDANRDKINEEKWTGKAYRVESGFSNLRDTTAGDVVRFERDELGNVGDFAHITDEKLKELNNYSAHDIAWYTKNFEDAKRYSETDDFSDIEEYELSGEIIATDGDGGYLVLNNQLKEDLEYHNVVGDATKDQYMLDERQLSSMAGSSTVEIKKKCRLGGLGNTSAQCNWGDINAVDIKPLKEEVNEEVNAKEMRSDIAAIKSILNGKRGVAFTEINKSIAQKLEKKKIGVIPTRMTSNNTMFAIIYTDKVNAYLLYEFAKKNNGYLLDKTSEEAREIGKLLNYSPSDIEQHIRNKYNKKPPLMPDKSPDDFNDLAENASLDFWDLNEEKFPEFEKDIQQDLTTHQLDKKYIRSYQDGEHTYNVYAVNGDEVRDSGFIEWVDGGNHWVDADLPKIEQKYAKHIGENDYWIDDVFMVKPADFEAILLHERTESFIIRHYGYEYNDAHNIANKVEMMFRKKIPDGANRALAEKIYDIFVANFKPEKSKQKHKPVNEMLNEAQIILININEAKSMMKI